MLCPWCQSPNRDNAKFCKGCGQLLAVETVAAGPVPTTQTGQQSQEGIHEFVPVPPGTTPPPPPPSSLGLSGNGDQENAILEKTQVAPAVDPNDPSQAPTQILTPEEAEIYRQRRVRLENTQPAQNNAGGVGDPAAPYDISEAPTILAPFVPAFAPVGGEPHPALDATLPAIDSASQPTVYAPVPTPPPPPVESQQQDVSELPTIYAPLEGVQSEEKSEVEVKEELPTEVSSSEEKATPTEGESEADIEEPSAQTGEEAVESEQPEATPAPTSESSNFPVLTVGHVVGERYEITNVVSQEPNEHVYEVTDKKGYLHCWNCNSEENAEGDEFCNDCGAELLNALYTMHEYPASPDKTHDETVLHASIVNTLIENQHTYVIALPQTLQATSPNGVHLVASSTSDVGVARMPGPNEDSTLVLQLERVHESVIAPAGIFLVSDGMGGHANGQLASRMTAGIIAERIVRDLLMPPLESEKAQSKTESPDGERLKEILRDAIDDANSAICQLNHKDKSDMGATLTGFMAVGDRAYIFNVGDSRTYMLRDGKLYQLTNDHSLVGQLVAGGLIAPEDVYTHPQRSQIYRSIGDKLNVQIDVTEQIIHPGDILLSCSDGLWEMVRDPQIADILNTAPDPQTASAQLIEAANNNGGEDNISAVVVFVR